MRGRKSVIKGITKADTVLKLIDCIENNKNGTIKNSVHIVTSLVLNLSYTLKLGKRLRPKDSIDFSDAGIINHGE